MPTLASGPREGQRETVQARALLEKAERLREKVSAEDRAELDRLTGRVREALTDRRWGDLTAAVQRTEPTCCSTWKTRDRRRAGG